MGFFRRLFFGSDDDSEMLDNNATGTEEQTWTDDFFRSGEFFGFDLTNAPNHVWTELAEEYSEGKIIRNFEICDLKGTYFTKAKAIVVGKGHTNFLFTCPYSLMDACDIFFCIERDFVHHGNYIFDYAARDFKRKHNSLGLYDLITWNQKDLHIALSRDIDSGDLHLLVITNFYNKEFLEQDKKEESTASTASDSVSAELDDDSIYGKTFKVQIPIHNNDFLEFVHDDLKERLADNGRAYFIKAEKSIVYFFSTKFPDLKLLAHFYCPQITNYVENDMAWASFRNVDIKNSQADINVTKSGSDWDSNIQLHSLVEADEPDNSMEEKGTYSKKEHIVKRNTLILKCNT